MSTRRLLNIVLLILVVSTATLVFETKKRAARDAEEIEFLADKIAAEKQRISELNAEWSMLDDPARLQELVDRHNVLLQLEPMKAAQIGSFADIPMRTPVTVPATAVEAPQHPRGDQ